MKAFCTVINDQSLTSAQIAFVRKVIDYNIMENGYIEATAVLMKPPFDRPHSFIRLFDGAKQKQLVEIVNAVRGVW
ncbi:type I restriction-modification enzyme R subunit C-terminal domain-containing protein [Paenibacillus thiaminolyticus]|uniref:type I restriction-modification enzyme R subunit C-terminal domain-containing protein n=1 Tax=Paenibacillus thiaminolyticus TaxID=49283 RepID=UPI002175B643|nr:type I restriction-modification enzyme R subunit C-terminal domain-containing protein [Paenibacillus thiaminolyticus]